MESPDILLCQLYRGRLGRCDVTAVTIQKDHPLKAVSLDTAANVAEHTDISFQCHSDGPNVSHIEVGKPSPYRRRDNDGVLIHAGCDFCRQMIWDADINIHGTMWPMLLNGTDRDDHYRSMP